MTREEYIDFANALKNNYTIDFDKLPEFCDMAISALAENKTQMIDKSNFDEEQYKMDLQSAYDCGYNNAFGGENKLTLGSGATPFTVADAVIRECPDREWLKDAVFFINAYIERTYTSDVKGDSE